MKTVSVYLKQNWLKEQNFCDVSSENHAMCLLLECWKLQPFLRGIVTIKFSWMETFCSMEVELTWMGLWNGALEGQLLFNERGISGGWRSGQKALDMWANCVLKPCLSLKTLIPNFQAFFVSLGILYLTFAECHSPSLQQNESLRRPLFHYPPPRRWTMSISQR